MSDEMPEHNRRWEDVERLAQAAARQEITPVRLTVDRIEADVRDLKGTVFGNPVTRQRGMVDRLEQIEERIAQMGHALGGQIVELGVKIDGKIAEIDKKVEQQIDEGQARSNQIKGAQKAFYVLATVLALIGGPPAIIALLKAFGITP